MDEAIFTQLVLIHAELLMLERILLKQIPEDYEKTLDNKIQAQNDLMTNLYNKITGNGGVTNG